MTKTYLISTSATWMHFFKKEIEDSIAMSVQKKKKPESTFQSYNGENRDKEEAEEVRHDLL